MTLALGLARRPIRQKVIDTERFGVCPMRVQRMHHRRPLLDHTNPCVAVAVDPPLVPLGHAEPPLQVQVVLHRREVLSACEKAGAETVHQVGHVPMNRIAVALQTRQDRIKVALACG